MAYAWTEHHYLLKNRGYTKERQIDGVRFYVSDSKTLNIKVNVDGSWQIYNSPYAFGGRDYKTLETLLGKTVKITKEAMNEALEEAASHLELAWTDDPAERMAGLKLAADLRTRIK